MPRSPQKNVAAACRSRFQIPLAARPPKHCALLRLIPFAVRTPPARFLPAAAHSSQEFPRSCGLRTPRAPRHSPPAPLPPCCPESPKTDCAPLSTFEWCDPVAMRFGAMQTSTLPAIGQGSVTPCSLRYLPVPRKRRERSSTPATTSRSGAIVVATIKDYPRREPHR